MVVITKRANPVLHIGVTSLQVVGRSDLSASSSRRRICLVQRRIASLTTRRSVLPPRPIAVNITSERLRRPLPLRPPPLRELDGIAIRPNHPGRRSLGSTATQRRTTATRPHTRKRVVAPGVGLPVV